VARKIKTVEVDDPCVLDALKAQHAILQSSCITLEALIQQEERRFQTTVSSLPVGDVVTGGFPPIMNMVEAAKFAGVSLSTLHSWRKTDEDFPCYTKGSRNLIPLSEFREYLCRNRTSA